MQKPTIKILIADAHYLVRAGLVSLLESEPDFDLIGDVANQEELMEGLAKSDPDVLIMDHKQDGAFSIESLSMVKSTFPSVQVLIISEDSAKDRIYRVLEAGVNSFLTKSCGPDEIVDAVRATAKKEKFYCTKIIDILLEKSFPNADHCAPTPLSPREVEVVRYIAMGKLTKEIAAELDLSPHTVYTHRKRILRKLELNSASELVRYAIEQGLVN